MKWIVVKIYGDGKYMSTVYPAWFEWLSQAERKCKELNGADIEECPSDRWIAMPVTQYIGDAG